MYARVSKVMAQFVLKIEKLSHIMGLTPILEMARAYGLRRRLWLLLSIDHKMMSFIKKAIGKPRLHVSVNLLFGAWPPCCATAPSSPSSSFAPASNTASHDNHEKINSWVSFTFHGYGALLGGLRPPELLYNWIAHYSIIILVHEIGRLAI